MGTARAREAISFLQEWHARTNHPMRPRRSIGFCRRPSAARRHDPPRHACKGRLQCLSHSSTNSRAHCLSILNVVELRNSGIGEIDCCHSLRAAPNTYRHLQGSSTKRVSRPMSAPEALTPLSARLGMLGGASNTLAIPFRPNHLCRLSPRLTYA
jgi:hypothetical protein